MQRRIERGADHVTEEKKATTAFKEKVVIFVAQKNAPPSDSSSLSPSAIISEALKFYYRMYDCSFQEIAEMYQMGGVSLDDQVSLAPTDPPYNVSRESGSSGADHANLATDDTAAITMICRQCIKSESHDQIFCCNVQFSK